ncbi:hypothetical protein TNIN_279091 [Trichonephila inaurata madagascariensis]|uniref:Uncharacterized protein n=1 Tax=Trichonephila inaurata madagascariensis TaxID=2747483 RepID=A0A8X6YD44_9ARAC|nr:hypothetical protein TNIN_279091 [Trichonephila inaurata madagascariensis]
MHHSKKHLKIFTLKDTIDLRLSNVNLTVKKLCDASAIKHEPTALAKYGKRIEEASPFQEKAISRNGAFGCATFTQNEVRKNNPDRNQKRWECPKQ